MDFAGIAAFHVRNATRLEFVDLILEFVPMKRLGILLAGLSLLALSTNATPGIADTVKIVVPFAAGGPVDQLARILAAELGSVLGDSVIVENRGGAGGALGSEMVARAAPDGNTILLASLGSQVLSPLLKPPTTYDPIKAFAPVMLVGSVPSLLVVSPKHDVSTLNDLIARAKRDKLLYGSAGDDNEHRCRNVQLRSGD